MTKEKAATIQKNFQKEYEKIPNVNKTSQSPIVQTIVRRRPMDILGNRFAQNALPPARK